MRAALVACLLAGCASGRSNGNAADAGDELPTPDAKKVFLDGAVEPQPDAPAPDAAIPPDAAVPPDAPSAVPPDAMVVPADAASAVTPDARVPVCTDRQLLANPVLDLSPRGIGWYENPIDNSYPIITGDGNPIEDTAPYKAWLGGFVGGDFGVSSVSDELHQDVAIPANTTALHLRGKYAVGSDDFTSGVYDTAQLAITQTNGTPIQVLASYSNLTTTTNWVAFDYTVSANLSGQTVRVRAVSSNDYDGATSFFFDSFALVATVCE